MQMLQLLCEHLVPLRERLFLPFCVCGPGLLENLSTIVDEFFFVMVGCLTSDN